MPLKTCIVTALSFLAAFCCMAEKLTIVAFNGIFPGDGSPTHTMPLEAYGIETKNYWPDEKWTEKFLDILRKQKKTEISFSEWKKKHRELYKPLNDDFAADLESAQLLYFSQHIHDGSSVLLDKYPDAVRKFLARGGVIFFDYFSARSGVLTKFLKSAGVENPSGTYSDLKTGECSVVIWKGCQDMPLFKTPHNFDPETKFDRGYGWWEKWSDKQFAPLRNAKEPGKMAVMIVQENVLGKGKIIFNHYPMIFRGPAGGGNKKLLENTLSYIFGTDITKHKDKILTEQGGPGKPAE